MKKKTLGTVVVVIIAVIAAGLRFSRRLERINQRAERQKIVQQAETVQKAQGNLNDAQNKKTAEFIKSIADKNKNESNQKYDKYTPVEVNLGIGKKDGKYYIVDGKENTSVEIEDAQKVHVLYIEDNDRKAEYMGIFVQDRQGWKYINRNQQVIADFGKMDIDATTKFVVKENDISIKK